MIIFSQFDLPWTKMRTQVEKQSKSVGLEKEEDESSEMESWSWRDCC